MFVPTGPNPRQWLRPVIALAVVAALGTVFWLLSDGKEPARTAREAKVGDCLENRGTHAKPVLFTVNCADAKADYKIRFTPGPRGECPAEFTQYEERGGRLGDTTLCLTRVDH